MAELLTILTEEAIILETIPIMVSGSNPKRAEVEAALIAIGVQLPLVRGRVAQMRDGNKLWLITYDKLNDEFSYERLNKCG